MMGVIVRKPPVSTKIAVAIDHVQRWQNSERRLLEGEIAVSYENVYDPKDHRNHKRNFLIRIGRKLPDGSCSTWKDAAPLSVSSLSPDLRAALISEILQKAGEKFVIKSDFNEAVSQIAELANRMDNKVRANVKSDTLYLLKDSEQDI